MRPRRFRWISLMALLVLLTVAGMAMAAPGIFGTKTQTALTQFQPAPAPGLTGASAGDAWRLPSLTTAEPLVIQAPSGPAKPLVVGYYAEDWQGDSRALAALRQAGSTVDRVVNFQLRIDAAGTLTGRPYPELDGLARTLGLQQYGLVHNYATDNFSSAVARAVLATPESRRRAAEQILAAAKTYGLAGIDLDLENLPADLRPNYTAFVQELSTLLKQAQLGFTISIPAKTYDDTTSNWGGAFDYQALGRYADQVAIMAYDEHTIGLPAGAVASLPWVEKVAAYAASQIEPSKLLLGIPGYGYDWVVGTTRGRALSFSQAQSLATQAKTTIQWDPWAQVPFLIYWEGGVQRLVYFENAKSTALKLDVVAKYKLGGIAFWRLGLEDPATWPTVQQKLK